MESGFSGADTIEIIRLAQAGDETAKNLLLNRVRPVTLCWLRGRLPQVRDMKGTEDLVQEVLLRTIRRLPVLNIPSASHFMGYLYRASINALRTECIHLSRRPAHEEIHSTLSDPTESPELHFDFEESLARFDRCMQKLSPKKRGLVATRIPGGKTLDEIQVEFGYKSREAARVAVFNATNQLLTLIARDRSRGTSPKANPPRDGS